MKKPKMSALVASAIRNLREIRGSTSKEIMNYIKSQFNTPDANVQKQVCDFSCTNVLRRLGIKLPKFSANFIHVFLLYI